MRSGGTCGAEVGELQFLFSLNALRQRAKDRCAHARHPIGQCRSSYLCVRAVVSVRAVVYVRAVVHCGCAGGRLVAEEIRSHSEKRLREVIPRSSAEGESREDAKRTPMMGILFV